MTYIRESIIFIKLFSSPFQLCHCFRHLPPPHQGWCRSPPYHRRAQAESSRRGFPWKAGSVSNKARDCSAEGDIGLKIKPGDTFPRSATQQTWAHTSDKLFRTTCPRDAAAPLLLPRPVSAWLMHYANSSHIRLSCLEAISTYTSDILNIFYALQLRSRHSPCTSTSPFHLVSPLRRRSFPFKCSHTFSVTLKHQRNNSRK